MLISAIYQSEPVTTSICINSSGKGGGSLAKKFAQQNRGFVFMEADGLKSDFSTMTAEHTGLDFGVRLST